MNKVSFALILFFLHFGCENQKITHNNSENINAPTSTMSVNSNSDHSIENTNSDSPNEDRTYPGITINQEFSFIEEHSFTEENYKEKTYLIEADNFQIKFNNFAPTTISRGEKDIFNFKTLYPNNYHDNLVGISNLLGKNSKEIYVVADGPGATCCTNYWITDVSNEIPKNIFRSEDYGGFRGPMEIFDADGDGVYELMQFDSTFRYFLDDCGACSPEPRAIFKYDKQAGKYLPAKNIQQDFVKESFRETEKWIPTTFEKLSNVKSIEEAKTQEYIKLELEYNSKLLNYIIDLFYLGDERKAWKTFDKYHFVYNKKEKVRAEIKNRLRQSKFFQALKKSS